MPRLDRMSRGRVLVIEDDRLVLDAMRIVLEQEGYEFAFAVNGYEALTQLRAETLPDIIVLDLIMPEMDGWQFRAIQRHDVRLSAIPVVALSGDRSAKAAAISAQAYLRKPVNAGELLAVIDRLLVDNERHQMSARVIENERLTSLGRLAAAVGHEINNPLSFVLMNLNQSLIDLRLPDRPEGSRPRVLSEVTLELEDLRARVVGVCDMLEDCQVGAERMRATVGNLQRLSRQGGSERITLDVHGLIDESVSMVWTQIRQRARLIKTYGVLPSIPGDRAALGQVFLNLLVNATQAIPEGQSEKHEIRISTRLHADDVNGDEVVVEVRDSGMGMAPETLLHAFEPFFTTKPMGQGTGLGLSISREAISQHRGRITVESIVGMGTVFRIFLPVGGGEGFARPVAAAGLLSAPVGQGLTRGRILVVDDEKLVGRSIKRALADEHDTVIVEQVSEALARLEHGERFDVILCDVVMPGLGGSQFYDAVAQRWPQTAPRIVFMTGGAFTPETVAFLEQLTTRVLYKPFKVDGLKTLIRDQIAGNS